MLKLQIVPFDPHCQELPASHAQEKSWTKHVFLKMNCLRNKELNANHAQFKTRYYGKIISF